MITEAGYGDQFIHRTGHDIGVTTHEPPYMVEGERQPLVPGMCFSIERDIYLAGDFGVRIEDIVTVTPDGVDGSTTLTTRSPSSNRIWSFCAYAKPTEHWHARGPTESPGSIVTCG